MKKTLLGAFGALLTLSACASDTDATRCEAFKEVFKQNEVLFATGKAELTPESKNVLNKQVAWLKANPTKKIIVQGYADPRGTEAYNMQLGQKRADAVKDYLVRSGINPNRVSVVSFGATELATTQNTAKGWAEDRRTVSVIVTQ